MTSAESALTQLEIEHPQLVLSDVRLPGRDGLALFDEIRKRHPTLPVILLTAHGTIPDAVEATARGVFTYLTKPYDGRELLDKIAQALALGAPAADARQGRRRKLARARSSAAATAWPSCWPRPAWSPSPTPACCCAATAAPARSCWRARSTAPARARDKPFVAVNCGAIPEALLESELFGHMKGAFTDAVANHKGLFQQADGGTLLLDEIGDMPPALQVKLLRVLQERAVRPLGASQSIAVDVRIISATHRDLDAAMDAGQFREDLYYRLNVVTLSLPPLSARREDIPLLANHFLQRLSTKYGKRLSGFAPEALEGADHRAPGPATCASSSTWSSRSARSSSFAPDSAGAGAARAAGAERRGADLRRGQAALRARLPGRPAQADRRQCGRRGPPGRPQPDRVLPPAAEARTHAGPLQGRCGVAGSLTSDALSD